jgi:hypothetical protein
LPDVIGAIDGCHIGKQKVVEWQVWKLLTQNNWLLQSSRQLWNQSLYLWLNFLWRKFPNINHVWNICTCILKILAYRNRVRIL